MKKIKFALFKNLILSSVLLVTIIILTFSWFTHSSEANAEGIYIKCEIPPGIEVAVVKPGETPKSNQYSVGSVVLSKDNQDFLSELDLANITGDGKTFYEPLLTQTGNGATPNLSGDGDWDKASANVSYISFDLYIRSKEEKKISLLSDSNMSTVANVITGKDSANKSTEGDFSRDCIVGATRLSMLDSSNNKIMLWIPRPDLRIVYDEENIWMDTNVAKNKYSGETYTHTYCTVDQTGKKVRKTDSDVIPSSKDAATSKYVFGENKEITVLSGLDENGYYTSHVRCNIWLEGEDSEARMALVNGRFQVFLDLDSD